MKLGRVWLRELLGVEIALEQLSGLADYGIEVESIKPNELFTKVVVGEVLTVAKHPNADRLAVCEVAVGAIDQVARLKIVCGASNVKESLKVAVALPGAELPGGLKIKKSKIREIESDGMLCSAAELGLNGIVSNGIIELSSVAPIGMELDRYLKLEPEIIDLAIPANRGDCLSLLGIAREISAISNIPAPELKIDHYPSNGQSLPVEVIAKDLCSNYCGRLISGVDNSKPTPEWLRERLQLSGINSINPVVDITNYVMLELGQPMHAFDLNKINQKIVVRRATNGEQLLLLNDRTISLISDDLVITDGSEPIALAGVMGTKASGVLPGTTEIFLESAFFERALVAAQSNRYEIKSDSSFRYERGVDYNLQKIALERATDLLVSIVGGVPGKIIENLATEYLPVVSKIKLNRSNMDSVLGLAINDDQVTKILSSLGMAFEKIDSAGWLVEPPSYRFDLIIEEDLIEEIIRIYGYDKLPETELAAGLSVNSQSMLNNQRGMEHLYHLMVSRDYHEVITYSFISEQHQKLFDSTSQEIKILNPVSAELSMMRNSLIPGLVNALSYNLKRNQTRIRFFEIGLKFLMVAGELKQQAAIAGAVCGTVYSSQWGMSVKTTDFFDLKSEVTAILKAVDHNLTDDQLQYLPTTRSYLHPRCSAEIMIGDDLVGFIGKLHPKVQQELDLATDVWLFEIDLSSEVKASHFCYRPISKYPSIIRDLSVVIDKGVLWIEVKELILETAGKLLVDFWLFDLYEDKMSRDKYSVAMRLVFQSLERTLTDDEVEGLMTKLISKLKESFDACLRGE